MSSKGAGEFISNPIGKTLSQVGLETPKIKLGQYTIDPLAMTNPLGAIGQVQNAATVTEQKRLERKAAAEDKAARAADEAAFNQFANQENALLTSQDIMMPVFKSSVAGKKSKEADALAQVFNARKQEAMQRKTTPGVSQTRSRFM